LSQQNHLIERLRVELNAAREEKNAVEHHYSDSLKDIETIKKEYDEVKKFNEVITILITRYSFVVLLYEIEVQIIFSFAKFYF